jgi:hypothetical protein
MATALIHRVEVDFLGRCCRRNTLIARVKIQPSLALRARFSPELTGCAGAPRPRCVSFLPDGPHFDVPAQLAQAAD